MSSKRRVRRRACTSKVRYKSSDDAWAALRHQGKEGLGLYNAYRCRFCGGYHLGHTPAFVREAIRGSL